MSVELWPLRYRHRLAGFGEHDHQDLGGFGIARIARHRVKLAGRLVEGLALSQRRLGTVVELDLVGALYHIAECMVPRMAMGLRSAILWPAGLSLTRSRYPASTRAGRFDQLSQVRDVSYHGGYRGHSGPAADTEIPVPLTLTGSRLCAAAVETMRKDD